MSTLAVGMLLGCLMLSPRAIAAAKRAWMVATLLAALSFAAILVVAFAGSVVIEFNVGSAAASWLLGQADKLR